MTWHVRSVTLELLADLGCDEGRALKLKIHNSSNSICYSMYKALKKKRRPPVLSRFGSLQLLHVSFFHLCKFLTVSSPYVRK